MKRVVIVAAKRTPFGRFFGSLAGLTPVDLAVAAGEAVLNGLDRTQIQQVILGNILGAGHGMNIARQVALRLGLPIETSATTINMMCGSGMQSASLAANAIQAGAAQAVLAGGTESMTQSSLLVRRPPKKQAPDFSQVRDSLQCDGLVDAITDQQMGQQVELLAAEFRISRSQQDQYALRSQKLYGAARERGEFADELAPVGDVAVDQHPRPDLSAADLAQLKPAFAVDGTITAGNASGINDGAALLLLAEREFAIAHAWPILAEWISGVAVGCEPARMGLGPAHAIQRLFQTTDRNWSDVDMLEINEAFAAQVLACLQQLKLGIDLANVAPCVTLPDGRSPGLKFNSAGGAIAIGHPLAVSGARLLTHLAWRIFRGESRAAIGTLCVGGGQGIAALLASHR